MRRSRRLLEKPIISMTPMIDVVFLLLAFFVLTFRIIVPEGDFNVQMMPQGQAVSQDTDTDSVKIRLLAQADGSLSAILLEGEPVEYFEHLRQRVSVIVLRNPDLSVEMFPDEHLHYAHIIDAITAVNGEIRDGQIRKITDNIKFVRERLIP